MREMLETQRRDEDSEDPWLFYREGFDWRWHSRGRVVDLVFETAESFRLASTGDRGSAVAKFAEANPGLSPDTVVLSLVMTVVNGQSEGRRLDRSPSEAARALGLQLASGGEVGGALGPSQQQLEELMSLLDDRVGDQSGADRSILCMSPKVGLMRRVAASVWAFSRHAAVVVESDDDLFVETVKWARPSLVICRFEHLSRLRRVLESSFEGRMRRFSRLRTVFVERVESERGQAPVPGTSIGSKNRSARASLPSWSDEIEICWWER